jgi:DNA-binding transcriptional LysR family regulator
VRVEHEANPLSGAELAAFVAAVDSGSVGGAADALDLTQSAVTKRIQSLETRLGTRLFDRGRFGVRPTESARALYPEARQALDALRRAERAVTGFDGTSLRVAASFTVGEFLLPAWLGAFRLQEPDLRVRVDVTHSPSVLRELRDGRADVGFVEGLDPLDGFRHRTLRDDELRLTVSAGHRWARRRTLRAAELGAEPYVAREAGSGTRSVADAALARAGIALRPTLEVASTQGVKRALASGDGFALLSPLSIADEVREGTLVAVRVADVDLRRRLVAVHLGRTPPTAVARRFWRWLGEQAE